MKSTTEHDHHHLGRIERHFEDIVRALNRIERGLHTLHHDTARIVALVTEGNAKMSDMDDRIAALTASSGRLTGLVESAISVINGINQMVKDAVDAALAAGATPAQLQAVTDVTTGLDQEGDKLAAAIPAGTPAASTP